MPVTTPIEDQRPLAVFEARQPGMIARIRETWQRRHLIGFFASRMIRKRYARTFLGPVWLFLRPGLQIGAQAFVFGGVLKVSTGGTPYLISLLIGLFAWHWFAESAYWTTRCLELNRSLLRRMYVPRGTLLVGSLTPSAVDAAITCGFLAIALIGYVIADGKFWLDIGWATLLVPAGVALLVAQALALGSLLAVPGVRYRDIRFSLRIGLGFVYFLTPIAYPISAAHGGYRTILEANPLTAGVTIIRHGLQSDFAVPTLSIITGLGTIFPALALGLWVYFRAESAALDHI
jgi:lipopolysaccharide transport system permease protein